MELESSTKENSSGLPEPTGSFAGPVPWDFRAALIAVSLLLTANIVVTLVVIAVNLAVNGLDLAQNDMANLDQSDIVILGVVGAAMTMFAVWLVAVRGKPGWVENLAITKPRWLAAVGMVIVGQMVIFGFMLGNGAILQAVGIKDTSQEKLMELLVDGKASLLISLVVVSVLAPISEELLFRGVLYRVLRSKMTLAAAAIISGSVFAFSHLSPFSFLPLAFMGVTLAYVYERTGSIVPPIMLHSLNNTLALLIAYYFVR